jgi:hypothetical protein
MHDRIHQALDGERPADGLTPDERAELQRHRAIIGIALGPVRRLPSIDVVEEVLGRVSPRRGPFRWLGTPRTLTIRPAFALAGALALALAVSLRLLQPATPAAASARVMVQFRLGDAEASEVALVGDFNGWRPGHRLHRTAAGVWAVDVALAPGVYSYVFVVDGESIRLDPLAPRVSDGFGGSSSRLAVLAPERSS